MSSHRDERTPLEGTEKEFLDRLAEAYTPEPMTAGERAAFDDGIRTRLERPRRRPLLVPAIGAAAAAGLLWLVVSVSFSPTSPPEGDDSAALPGSSWEDELFLSSDFGASEDRDESGTLPDDYVAIASAFLDG